MLCYTPDKCKGEKYFKKNYSIYKVDDVLNSIDIYDINKSKLLNKEFKKFIYNEKIILSLSVAEGCTDINL